MTNDQGIEAGTTPTVRWRSEFLTHAMKLATVPNDAQSLLRSIGIGRMSDLSLLEESDWNYIADEWAKTESRNLLWHRRLKSIASVVGRNGTGNDVLSRPFTSYHNIEEICNIDKIEYKRSWRQWHSITICVSAVVLAISVFVYVVAVVFTLA